MKEHRESYQDKVCVELKLSVPQQEGCPRNQQPQDMSSKVVSTLTQPKEEDTGLEGKRVERLHQRLAKASERGPDYSKLPWIGF